MLMNMHCIIIPALCCISKLHKCYVLCVYSTVAEVVAQLEDEGSADSLEEINIFLEPPVDDGISDQDSDKSDGEVELNINHLGRKLLSAGCQVRRSSRMQQQQQQETEPVDSSDEESHDESTTESVPDSPSPAVCDRTVPVKRRKTVKAPENVTWTKQKTLPITSDVQSYVGRNFLDLANFTSPLQFFEQFFDEELIVFITEQTNLYASQNNVS
jgi:hypothetical protein